MESTQIIQTLEDGLVLRSATQADMENIAQFNGQMHVDPGQDFVEHIARWTRDLGSGTHPTATASDFTVVEDTTTGKIVSTMCLIGQTWAYEGIEFPVGRPELVGTLAEYRRRGLVRKQFEVVHRWSAERGHLLQFITGIPWYYRQFGYEMAVNLGGQRLGYLPNIPELKEKEKEAYLFRPAEEKDLPFITDLYQKASRRSLLSCVRDADTWQYELKTRTRGSSHTWDIWIIETPEGEPVGYLFTVPTLYSGKVYVRAVEVAEGVSWFAVAHPLLRHLRKIAETLIEQGATEGKPKEITGYSFDLGEEHPLYHLIPNRLPLKFDPYAYYIRVPDLPGFLNLISPLLEERLAKSYMVGHTGELTLNFFKGGIRMDFERGKIKEIVPWQMPVGGEPSAHFPDLTFLQLLFGFRDTEALEDAFPDLYYPKEGTRYLLKTLFPHKPSKVYDLS